MMSTIKSEIDLKIVNVVATGDTEQSVDIIEIGKFRWGLYDQEIYGGRVAYVKDASMIGRVTVFPSGKLISVGTRSIPQAFWELGHTVELLVQAKLVKPHSIAPRVRNIVSRVRLSSPVYLESLSMPMRDSRGQEHE